jgi:hypothetical protein
MNPPKPYDFAVAYRVYPRIGREAIAVFDRDKFLLTRVAFQSFVRSIRQFKVKLWVLLDSCPPDYEEFFRGAWPGPAESLQIVNYQNKGNFGTFQEQISILEQQDDADLCYVGEDDYFFLPDCFPRIHELFRTHPDIEFVTPYDHLEYYVSAHQEMSHDVLPDPGLPVWRTVPSTTCSFLARSPALRDCAHAFRSYGKGLVFNYGTDGTMWLAITKHRIFNPWRAIRWIWTTKYVAWSWLTAWMLCGRDILTKPRRKLWAPIPSLALHLVHSYLPPGIDWDQLLRQAVAEDKSTRPSPK